MTSTDFEYILVGGGLQNGLIALALLAERPGSRIAIVEREALLGGNHTWCFHQDDLPAAAGPWIAPLICHRWAGYRVLFPNLERRIDDEYAAITSERFREVVTSAMAGGDRCRVVLNATATEVADREVQLATGERLTGAVVIDSRGPAPSAEASSEAGFQKFLGLEVNLSRPHGLEVPTLMDAKVDQTSGFRFLYVLPLNPRRLLVEDTYFHESPDLKPEQIKLDIARYLDDKGYSDFHVIREETGVLPMPWSGSLPARATMPLRAGYGGGWFHPGTGYSFPVASRLAVWVSGQEPGGFRDEEVAVMAREHRRQARFCHLLNDFLFRWYPPSQRWHIFERFYRLPEETIRRFYSLSLKGRDQMRLLSGRPPRGLSLRYRLQRREPQ